MALIDYTNEYGKLKKIALYRPRIDEIYQGKPEDVMYIARPKPDKVLYEFDEIVNKFRELNVEVVVLEETEGSLANCPNMIFLRDIAAVIRDKIILANMRYPVRKYEPEKFRYLLTKQNALYDKHFLSIVGNQTMEGADVLVASSNRIYAYTGHRTSPKAVLKIADAMSLKISNISANIHNIPQHLLGGLHILSPNLIARRLNYCDATIDNYSYVDLDETTEIASGFGMNVVTISPGSVLMPDNCPNTRKILEKSGITCHVIQVNEIHKMGGGLACMTLPLERQSA